MGVTYYLANFTKKESLLYLRVPAWKDKELAGNPVASAITSWYLLNNRGDWISFIALDDGEWPFPEDSFEVFMIHYRDMTDVVIEDLIERGILVDEGKEYYFDDEPDIYTRKLRNIWME